MHRMSAGLLGLTLGILFCLDAVAGPVEKLPASGKARFQVSYVQWAAAREIALGGSAGVGIFEFAGITRNTDGKPWFDRMTEHCVGEFYWGDGNGVPGNGSCVYVDADGDQVMVNWTNTEPYNGTKQIVGGTGKYAGISGKGSFKGVDLRPPAEGMDLFLTDVELDYQIKPPTQ